MLGRPGRSSTEMVAAALVPERGSERLVSQRFTGVAEWAEWGHRGLVGDIE